MWGGGDLFGRVGDVLVQGYAAVIGVLGLTVWLRSLGPWSPGRRVATAVVPLALGLAIVRPFADVLAFFPYTPAGAWDRGRVLWAAVAAAGAFALVATVGDAAWRRARPRATPLR